MTPNASHNYVFNGRAPLGWAVDRLHIRRDNGSGFINVLRAHEQNVRYWRYIDE